MSHITWYKISARSVVEDVNKDAKKLSLTEERVTRKTELELRSAGVKPLREEQAADHFLYISIAVGGEAFHVGVSFERKTMWLLPNETVARQYVSVWSTRFNGTHGGSTSFILDGLEQALETFLNKYLKANQE